MERVKQRLPSGALVLPLEFGEWHLGKFFEGGEIRTATLSFDQRTEDFYLHVSCALPVENPQTEPPEHFIGIDRGSRVDFALAVVDSEGRSLHRELIDAGSMRHKRQARDQLSEAQERGSSVDYRDFRTGRVDEALHKACNRVLEIAEEYRPCAVVVEYGLASIGGAAKGRRNARHYQKMLHILTYKLEHAGFPEPIERSAWKTSQFCAACGETGDRDGPLFTCPSCDNRDDADSNAAVNIARRGLLSSKELSNLRGRGGWEKFHQDLLIDN
jgi:transposase